MATWIIIRLCLELEISRNIWSVTCDHTSNDEWEKGDPTQKAKSAEYGIKETSEKET